MNKEVMLKKVSPASKREWEQLIGSKYHNAFKKIQLNKASTIIEIAPGIIQSVGRGLSDFNFAGLLYIIEPEPASLTYLIGEYKKILPNASIIGINQLLSEVIENQIFKDIQIDLVIGNHAIDDCIIGKSFESMPEFIDYFSNHYEKINIMNIAMQWQKLISNNYLLQRVLSETIREWKYIIEIAAHALVTAYDSHFFSLYKQEYPCLKYPDLLAQVVLQALKETLINYDNINISSETHWMCLKRISAGC